MFQYILKRILYGLAVLFGVIVVVFLLFNLSPGDSARMMFGQRADEESIQHIKHELGLDRSLTFQFGMYVNDLSPISFHNDEDYESHFYLDESKYTYTSLLSWGEGKTVVFKYPYLRRSYQSKREVWDILADGIPETAVLALTAIVFGTIVGVIMGVIAAMRKGKIIDRVTLIASVMGMSGPQFFMALLFSWFFGFVISDITGLNALGTLFPIDDYGREQVSIKNLILPAFTLGIRPLAVVMQLTRSAMLDVLSQDYIRTAKAKGLSRFKIIVKHALKNALNPVVTAVSGWFASLMAGAVFIEKIFDWKGIGLGLVEAVEKKDFPVAMGTVLFITVVFVVVNIFVDIAYGILDPRVRISK